MVPTLTLAILFGSRQEPKVSLELKGVRMENAAPVLAQTLGLNYLVVGPTLDNDVLLIRCKDVTPQELEEKIAKALNATWEQRSDGWRLFQTEAQIAQDRAIYDADRLKRYTKFVEGIHKGTVPAFSEATCKKLLQDIIAISKIERTEENQELIGKRLSGIDENSPMERLGLQIASRITPQMFMQLNRNRPKIVYCSRPTAMQLALPFPVDDLLKEAVQNQKTWLKIAGTNPVHGKITKASSDDGEATEEDLGTLNSSRTPYSNEDLSVVTITLNLSQGGVEIDAYSDKGDLTFSSNTGELQLDAIAVPYGIVLRSLGVTSEKDADQAGPKGEVAEFFDMLFARFDTTRDPKKKYSALLNKILQPEKYDPLSFAAPGIVFSRVKAANVVMVLDESMLELEWSGADKTSEDLIATTTIEKTTEWLVARLSNPVESREEVTDRKVFGPIVRYIDQNRRELTIEEDASLTFAEQWNKSPSWLFDSLKGLFKSDGQSPSSVIVLNHYGGSNDAGKRIYGSMTEGERRQGFRGEVSIGSLSDATRKEIFRAAYFGVHEGYSRGRFGGGVSIEFADDVEMTPELERLQVLVSSGALRDPTFAMPNGIQPEYRLKMEEVRSPTLSYAYTIEGDPEVVRLVGQASSSSQSDAYGLGRMLFEETRPREKQSRSADGEAVPDFTYRVDRNHIRIMTSRTIDITLRISKWLSMSWHLNGTVSDDPKVYTLSTLPKEFRDGIRKGYDEAEQEYKESKLPDPEKVIKRTPPPFF